MLKFMCSFFIICNFHELFPFIQSVVHEGHVYVKLGIYISIFCGDLMEVVLFIQFQVPFTHFLFMRQIDICLLQPCYKHLF